MRRRVRGPSLTFLEFVFVDVWVLILAAQVIPANDRDAARAKTRRSRLPLNIAVDFTPRNLATLKHAACQREGNLTATYVCADSTVLTMVWQLLKFPSARIVFLI